jgi:hypothetical protein
MKLHRNQYDRKLKFETLDARLTMASDVDDQISEAVLVELVGSRPKYITNAIRGSRDVDMYRIDVRAGRTIDFDIDTTLNGPGGLGSYIRLFNVNGTEIAFNNDAAAPGDTEMGFDSYLRYRFNTTGTYYLGVSNFSNRAYNPVTGRGDVLSNQNSTGTYRLRAQALPNDGDDTISEAVSVGSLQTGPKTLSGAISFDVDVDMFAVTVQAGQTVRFDIDTPTNGPNGLGSYIRLFNSAGTELAFNNDGAAPGESVGFDSYLQVQFSTAGTYYIGVSNVGNPNFNPLTGGGDATSWQYAVGTYQLVVTGS